jgi:3,4-dihydroxy 2-butanone 4-phosphate synthase / GTP cyclohydrolase II
MSRREGIRLDDVERAIADVAAGRPVIVVDDEDRENEGDIIFAASTSTPELMAWTIRHSSGVICVPMPAEMLDRLEIPLMTPHNRDRMRTAYTISVDARDGVSTGISAADRSHTVKTLADSATESWELTRPGHVFPLRYREGGVLARRGHTEAAVDLVRMAGLTPVGVLVEVVNDDGTMKRGQELRDFADEHDLALVSIDQLVHHRRRTETHVSCVAETRLPTRYGDFTAFGYRIHIDGSEHVALVYGDPAQVRGGEGVLCRVHSECLTGDVFRSARCDCGPQLEEAMERIVDNGSGVVVYLRGHEGRGIGLLAKLQAYQLQDGGRDTVDANLDLGLPADARHYGAASQVLKDLGVRSVRLLTNNPAKTEGLEAYGVPVVERVALTPHPNDHNVAYLRTKRERMGHDLPDSVLDEVLGQRATTSVEQGLEPGVGGAVPTDPDDPLSHVPDRPQQSTSPPGEPR